MPPADQISSVKSKPLQIPAAQCPPRPHGSAGFLRPPRRPALGASSPAVRMLPHLPAAPVAPTRGRPPAGFLPRPRGLLRPSPSPLPPPPLILGRVPPSLGYAIFPVLVQSRHICFSAPRGSLLLQTVTNCRILNP